MPLVTNFEGAIAPTPSGKENGLTVPMPGIGNPCLNTPVTQNEHVGITWRGGGFDEATDNARPAQLESVFGAGLGFESMSQESGGGGYPTGSYETNFGDLLFNKP